MTVNKIDGRSLKRLKRESNEKTQKNPIMQMAIKYSIENKNEFLALPLLKHETYNKIGKSRISRDFEKTTQTKDIPYFTNFAKLVYNEIFKDEDIIFKLHEHSYENNKTLSEIQAVADTNTLFSEQSLTSLILSNTEHILEQLTINPEELNIDQLYFFIKRDNFAITAFKSCNCGEKISIWFDTKNNAFIYK